MPTNFSYSSNFSGISTERNTFVKPFFHKYIDFGQNESNPATNAQVIKQIYPDAPNGYYWIELSGTSKKVYCDMDNGGWMYVTPPSGAEDTNPFGFTKTQSSSQTGCQTDSYSLISDSNWYGFYGYRCGTSNLTDTLTIPNSVGATQVRYVAFIGGGNSYYLRINGSTISPNQTNSANRYWNGQNVSTCNSNVCWRNESLFNSVQPRTRSISGNITFQLYAASACQPSCSWGVSTALLKVAVK